MGIIFTTSTDERITYYRDAIALTNELENNDAFSRPHLDILMTGLYLNCHYFNDIPPWAGYAMDTYDDVDWSFGEKSYALCEDFVNKYTYDHLIAAIEGFFVSVGDGEKVGA